MDPFAAAGALVERLGGPGTFAFRAGPKPPPRPGETLTLAFPPPTRPAARPNPAQAPPLKVVRVHPKGGVAAHNAITVSFNQPMVPLASLADLAKIASPLRVTPAVEGRTRWLGTDTVALEAKGRLPFSTRYEAEVPAGTKAASGRVLDQAVRWSFETPRLALAGQAPGRYHVVPTTPIALRFNQRIDVAKVFAATTLRGPAAPPLRLVPQTEWKALGTVGAQALRWEADRVMVVQPTGALQKDAAYVVTVAAGLVAGEGPLATPKPVVAPLRTYGPLRVLELRCGYRNQPCRPSTSKWLRFSNRLDVEAAEQVITVTPKVPDVRIRCSYHHCYLTGTFRPQTRYRVTVDARTKDIYDQTLGRPWSGAFWVGDASPQLQLPVSGSEAVTEWRGARTLGVRSVNVMGATVSLVRVAPEHLPLALGVLRKRWHRKYRGFSMANDVPGTTLSRTVRLNQRRNRWKTTALPLDLNLPGRRPGILFVELQAPDLQKGSAHAPTYRRVLVQVTDLGLTLRYDAERILVLVTGLGSGAPVGGAEVALYADDGKPLWQGRTAASGLAEAPGIRRLKHRGPVVVVVRKGDDAAGARLAGGGQQGWVQGYSSPRAKPPARRVLRSQVFTERDPYRPGETVHVTGILRVEEVHPEGGITALKGRGMRLKYWIRDARYRLVVKDAEVPVAADGTFRIAYPIPEDGALGSWQLRGQLLGSELGDATYVHRRFQVLHYRTPEVQVSVKVRGEPLFFGDGLQGTVEGRYYHGAGMAGAQARWTLRRRVGSFRPPGNEGFSFGELRDWTWRWRRLQGRRGGRFGAIYETGHGQGDVVAKGEGALDARGTLVVRAPLPVWKKPGHGSGTVGAFVLEAQVFDKNRQVIAGRKAMTVHPAAVVVGLRQKRALIKAGEDATVQVVVTNLDGARQAGHRVQVVATEQVQARKAVKREGRWEFEHSLTEKVVGGCSVTTGTHVVGCDLRLPRAGYYRLRAEAKDAKGRRTRSVMGAYAVGKRYVPWKQDNRGRLELVPDRQRYQPGDHAAILIKSPFRRATGLLTVERQGIRSYRLLALQGSAHVERVKLAPTDLPNVHVSVALVQGRVDVPGAAPGTDLGRPRFAQGSVSLKVDAGAKRLRVQISTADKARPGAKLPVRVKVTTADGRPVSGRVALMLVDEGVLSLLGYRVADPWTVFHNPKSARAALRDLRADLLRQDRPKRLRPPRDTRGRRTGYRYRRPGSGGAAPAPVRLQAQSVKISGGVERERAENRNGDRDEDGVPDAEDRAVAVSTPMAPSGGESGRRGPALAFTVRALFASTAYFNDGIRTDGAGRAEISVPLPENLTTFRITAVALDDRAPDRFGAGESRVTVRRPLMLQPALPRFANFGDRFEAAVKVTNETGKAGTATVRLQAVNAKPLGAVTRTVTLGAGQTEEVRFPVAIGRPGRATFRFLAFLERETDAVEVHLPVNLPATTEAFATYGTTEGSVAQPVQPPKDALTAFGGLEISLSSTALTGLQDAVRYLVNYPWECTEQTASRLIPIFALRQILPAFRLFGQRTEEGDRYVVKVPERFLKARKGLARAAVERQYLRWLATTGLDKLAAAQRYDGGFGYWGSASRSWPYPTAYAMYALLRGREAGFSVSDRTLSRGAGWLSNYLHNRHGWQRDGRAYSLAMRAMAVWVLSELQNASYLSAYTRRRVAVQPHLAAIYAERARLPLFGRAMLLQALHRAEGRSARVITLLGELDNAAIQDTPYKVHFREGVDESLRLLMHSESRTDAIVLAALLEVQPDHPLIPKVVRGLVEARVRGRWETTQANAYALVALSRYFQRFEKVPPDFRLRAWLGEGFLGETTFRGRSMRVVEQQVPMAFLRAQGRRTLVLEKQGAGRLYYRLGLRYAPTSLRLAPAEQGFSVSREYEAVEAPEHVTRLADGRVRIQAGTYVRVRLRIVVPSRRYFVAVDDPLPAGLEAVDLNLRTSASSTLAGQAKGRVYDVRSWYAFFAFSHQEKRDDRVVLFSDRLPAGVYEYSYLARATTPGTFVVPPLKAEEMYHPEVFGRSATAIVEVAASRPSAP